MTNRTVGRIEPMTTRWRRRSVCQLDADGPNRALIREINARGALIDTPARPRIGSKVTLHHPDAGTIEARVRAIGTEGISIAFALDTRSTAFALAAIAADMSRPR